MCFQVGFVASFVSKFSDTVSSEVGKAYGKTTYLINTLKIVPRGTEGAVSLEGTAGGAAAAALFAAGAFTLGQVQTSSSLAQLRAKCRVHDQLCHMAVYCIPSSSTAGMYCR